MSDDQPEDKTNDPLVDLFGEPALLEGEDKERYQRLSAVMVRDLKPKNVLDWINVRDQIDKVWEEQRYKRATTKLIESGVFKALEFYFGTVCRKRIYQLEFGSGSEFARKYFSDNPKERNQIVSQLTEHGITIADLHAKAMQIEGGGVQMLDRLVAARENGRRMLRKEAAQDAKRQDRNTDATTEE
jgi:hypothetical protein